MDKKFSKLIGIKKSIFDQHVVDGDIKLREARLIPILKPGDEMALTSVFLSSLRLIKEFRKMILSSAKISSGGKIYVYTEIEFPDNPDSRVDGLLLIERGGIIKDAAIFEMKNGKNELDQTQINRYIHLAKSFNIPKLITISNQFVSDPTQFPIFIRAPKGITLFHFSWSYLLTLAHILLFDNDTNIEDDFTISLYYSVDNGSTWNFIESGTFDGVYTWSGYMKEYAQPEIKWETYKMQGYERWSRYCKESGILYIPDVVVSYFPAAKWCDKDDIPISRDPQDFVKRIKNAIPYVDENLCIGCGICVTKCPLEGKAGIFVTNSRQQRWGE